MSGKTPSEMPEIDVTKDGILRDAIDRVKREATADAAEFFKHGQFGSHNA